jgi:uncharacterized membrane protein
MSDERDGSRRSGGEKMGTGTSPDTKSLPSEAPGSEPVPIFSPPRGQRLEILVGNLLRGGVLTAAAVVLLGGGLYLWRYGARPPHYEQFHAQSADLRSVGGILGDVRSGSSRGTIQLGILLLIATPVARVLLLVLGFAWQHDRTYVLVSLVVLGLLVYSLFGTS